MHILVGVTQIKILFFLILYCWDTQISYNTLKFNFHVVHKEYQKGRFVDGLYKLKCVFNLVAT